MEFVWAESHESLDYDNWETGEPNNDDVEEDCVHMVGGSFLWNEASCNRANRATYFSFPCTLSTQFKLNTVLISL